MRKHTFGLSIDSEVVNIHASGAEPACAVESVQQAYPGHIQVFDMCDLTYRNNTAGELGKLSPFS